MFDLNTELYNFYKEHVLLPESELTKLKDYRQRNLDRLNEGLDKLQHKHPQRNSTQGSITMKSIVQHPEENTSLDYDIDVAVIFRREDLPEDTLKARHHVLNGIIKGGGNFRQPPEARTNAVTVWYKEGYHVDMPVYRIYIDDYGNEVIEHAGSVWSTRDPKAIVEWFHHEVENRSPSHSYGAKAHANQLRRIVQLLKYHVRTRPSWDLPSGLIITALTVECYRPHNDRDDEAFYATLCSLYDRLRFDCEVYNPVALNLKLTNKDKYLSQVKRFREQLECTIDWLSPLFNNDCTPAQAARTWGKVFAHSYWENLAKVEEAKALGEQLRQAATRGYIYTNSSGHVFAGEPEGKSIQIPPHRYYGEEY